MKILLLALFFLSSCGSLKIVPNGCHNSGIWGDDNVDGKPVQEKKFSSEHYVFLNDVEVKLKDILKKEGDSCDNIRRVRVEFESTFFIKRTLNVYVQK